MKNQQAYRYIVYDLIVSSEFEIKELKPFEGDTEVDLTISFASLGLLEPDAALGISFNKDRQVFVFPFVAAIVLEGLNTILVEPKPGVSTDLLAVPILGPVLAVALHMRNKFLLHGSAVVHDTRAYGFIGDKGAGKSTLAAMLLKNPDIDFLTDDLFVIDENLDVLRGYSQMKLSEDAMQYADHGLGRVRPPPIEEFPKKQFLLNSTQPNLPLPIGGIFELRRANDTHIENLSLQEALRVLLRFSYISRFVNRELDDTEKRKLFEFTARIAASGKVKRLYVPDDISRLDQVVSALRSVSSS